MSSSPVVATQPLPCKRVTETKRIERVLRTNYDEVWIKEDGKVTTPVMMIRKAVKRLTTQIYMGKVDGLDYCVTVTTNFNPTTCTSSTDVSLNCNLGTDVHTGIDHRISIDKYYYDTKKWSVMTNLIKTRYMDRVAYLVEEYERICYETNAPLSHKTCKSCYETDSEDESQVNPL